MSTTKAANVGERVLTSRVGASRKLLARKAREVGFAAQTNVPLESSFPLAASGTLGIKEKAGSGKRHTGRKLPQQKLQLGAIQPNPNTVQATIVGIVAARGDIRRSELLDLMRSSAFPHPAARPHDRGWCQGYVAGAIRSGFLVAVAAKANADPAASSGAAPEG